MKIGPWAISTRSGGVVLRSRRCIVGPSQRRGIAQSRFGFSRKAKDKKDPDRQALACYGVWFEQSKKMLLRFVTGRPVSHVTIEFLEWVLAHLATEGKRVWVLVWDNASWHTSQKVRRWIAQHNEQAKRTGGVRLLVCPLPVKSPWLNPIEPRWLHGKRAIVEPDRKLTAQETMERICAHYGCELLKPIEQ